MSSLLRVIWFGVQGFRRNIWLSLVAVFTMTLMLTAMTVFVLANLAARQAEREFSQNIDYVIFLKDAATDLDIASLNQQVNARAEVASSRYTSKEEARLQFEQLFKNDETLQGVVTEENNPLPREIDVTFRDVNQIKAFDSFVLQERYAGVVEKTSYRDNAKAIENYLGFIRFLRIFGLSVTGFLVFVAIVVILNTIRLTIYSRREEIEIMRLVGATWQYIRGPFLVEGTFYGLLGAICASLIIWALLSQLFGLVSNDAPIESFGSLGVVALFARAVLHSPDALAMLINRLAIAELLTGVTLGVICSSIGVRKYLKG